MSTPQQPVNPLAASLIRTVVPLVAGVVITQLANLGLHLSSETVVAVLTAVFSAAYYAAVRTAEHFISAKAGWLLGVARSPAYPPKPPDPVIVSAAGGQGPGSPGGPTTFATGGIVGPTVIPHEGGGGGGESPGGASAPV